jgi:hypothetical protein
VIKTINFTKDRVSVTYFKNDNAESVKKLVRDELPSISKYLIKQQGV